MVIADRLEDLPAETTVKHDDGSIGVDLRRRIVWPGNAPQQTPALLAAACAVLNQAEWDDYPKLVEPVLCMLQVERDAFGAFCAAQGFPLPPFWFRADRRPATAKARNDARQWLIKEITAGAKQRGKLEYWLQAKALFPRLSQRAFTEIWAGTVPPGWREAGTRKKAS